MPLHRFARAPLLIRTLGALCVALLSLSACSDRPDLRTSGSPLPADTPWPILQPPTTLLGSTTAGNTTTGNTSASTAAFEAASAGTLQARAAALRARAARLSRTPVLAAPDRDRLRAAVQ